MEKTPRSKLTRTIRIRCEVSQADIEAMLDDYESGMTDATTSNAISRSVRRTIGTEEPVILERRHGGRAELEMDGYLVPLEDEISAWLTRVETGYLPKPISFDLLIPESLCGERVLDGDIADAAIGAQEKQTAA